jgi:hypothetical protein
MISLSLYLCMKVFRTIVGFILGYAIFVVSAVLLFRLSGVDPHADPGIGFMILTMVYGIAFGFLGGLVAQAISGTRQLTVNYILSGIMAGFAAFSLFKTTGNHYSQIAAIFLFAPVSVLGGLLYIRRFARK